MNIRYNETPSQLKLNKIYQIQSQKERTKNSNNNNDSNNDDQVFSLSN